MEAITLVVPSAQAGAILGKGGERIKEIRSSTSCDIIVQKGAPGMVLRRVEILGEKAPVALHLVLESGSSDESSQGESVTLQLMISPAYVGAIIGNKGETIQRLRSEHPNVFIDMEKHVGHTTDRILSFSGQSKDISVIILEVVDLIGQGIRTGAFQQHSGQKRQRTAPSNGGGRTCVENGPDGDHMEDGDQSPHPGRPRTQGTRGRPSKNALESKLVGTLSVSVETEKAGKVIGRRGATINQIRNESRCKVEMEGLTDASATHRKLEITGPLDGLEIACRMVNHHVETGE